MKAGLALVSVALWCASITAHALEGSIHGSEYRSPGDVFRVTVPVMLNPFVKKPSLIRDAKHVDGAAEVNFSVLELGEAWRFGVRSVSVAAKPDEATVLLAQLSDAELLRWAPSGKDGEVLLEQLAELAGGPALMRIYLVPAAALLIGSRGNNPPQRASALVGVAVFLASRDDKAMYTVGQFDMPNQGGHYTLETERGRRKLAEQHLKWVREMAASLHLRP